MFKEYRLPTDSNSQSLKRLQEIVNTIPEKLKSIPHLDFSKKPSPEKWSKKQILGHLIDSATNNHQRFVRAQFEPKPTILYDQEKWNAHGYYNELPDDHLIAFWELYNRHIIRLIQLMPEDMLEKECTMDDGSTKTISWLFDDYVRHMEHHLRQIFPSTNSL